MKYSNFKFMKGQRKLCGKKYLISSQTKSSESIAQKSGIALWLQFTVFPDASTIGGNKHVNTPKIIYTSEKDCSYKEVSSGKSPALFGLVLPVTEENNQ